MTPSRFHVPPPPPPLPSPRASQTTVTSPPGTDTRLSCPGEEPDVAAVGRPERSERRPRSPAIGRATTNRTIGARAGAFAGADPDERQISAVRRHGKWRAPIFDVKLTSFGGAIVNRTVRSRSAVVSSGRPEQQRDRRGRQASPRVSHATSSRRSRVLSRAAVDTAAAPAVAPEPVSSENDRAHSPDHAPGREWIHTDPPALFARQRSTIHRTGAGTDGLSCSTGGGSSRMIAVKVSTAVGRSNARRPVSIS